MAYYTTESCCLETFTALINRSLAPDDVPLADMIVQNVPVYDAARIGPALADPEPRRALMSEWGRVFGALSGVVLIKAAISDRDAIDTATGIFEDIIRAESQSNSGGDHFGERGANDRIWNALQKLCLRAPATFARYFASPSIAAICEAWLGPGYQMTAQVNLVRSGGKAQVAHRDYHLGFMDPAEAARFPAHAHDLSASLTLQGGIAHCAMPVESGPTKLLPFSQLYGPGYLACQLDEFRAAFETAHIQLPLAKGDAVFFNPAVFHAAGENRTTDIRRLANLLQISSPMGRATEAVDRTAMVRALYPVLRELDLGGLERAAVIAASAEGYAFPTNLDTDPPIGGLASPSQAVMMTRALDDGACMDAFDAVIAEQNARRQA